MSVSDTKKHIPEILLVFQENTRIIEKTVLYCYNGKSTTVGNDIYWIIPKAINYICCLPDFECVAFGTKGPEAPEQIQTKLAYNKI